MYRGIKMMYHKKIRIDLGDYSSQKNKSERLVAAINAVGKINTSAGVMKNGDYLKRHDRKKFEIDIDLD